MKENTGKVMLKLALLDYFQIFLRLLFCTSAILYFRVLILIKISLHLFDVSDEKIYFNIILF